MNFAKRLDRLRANAVLLIVCAVWVLPLVWAAGTALRPSNLPVGTGWLWLPGSPTFENFADAWDAAPFVTYYANTIVICTGILLVQLVTVTLGGYAFARVRFRGREWMFAVFLLQLLLPLPVLAEPNFLTMRDLHLIDNKLAIMLPYMASGFGVFLMRQAYRSVPIELEEAAVLDGCRWWQLLAYVYIPLTRPGLVAFSIVSITFHWNDFLWPLLVTNTPAARPLTVGLASFASAGENGAQFPLIMAGALLVMAPVLIVFLAFQRHFVASFVQSGFK
ncbi:MAG: carbohydrate ABC transporter permease [Chloroflexota bacterium]